MPESATGRAVSALSLQGVSATYRDRNDLLLALDSVSLEVRAQEFVALVGPSGSGKSTLLDIVSGLFAESAGLVEVDGEAIALEQRLGRSAYMRQRDLLLPWRSAVENAALALEARGVPKTKARATARQRFPEFGLAGFEESWPSQLSGGMRQRVAFLRTILADRSLLLLDEPFGALDALNRVSMQTWLAGYLEVERHPALLVTHDVDEAIFLADRVLVLSPRPGRIVHEERIDVPRPRRRSAMTSPSFLQHRSSLLTALGVIDESNVA